jgi:hypothetical protein
MTGYTSKRKVALDKLDDDDIQTYQRPWVGLTDEQIKKATWETSQKLLSFAAENGIAVKGIDEHVIAVGKAAIEAALRSKNT